MVRFIQTNLFELSNLTLIFSSLAGECYSNRISTEKSIFMLLRLKKLK